MRIVTIPMAIVAVSLLSLSCGADRREDRPDAAGESKLASDTEQPAEVYRGHAVHGHEVRSFRPCGSDDELWVIDSSETLWPLWKSLTSDPTSDQEVFVVVEARQTSAPVEGFGADFAGGLNVETVLYAGLEGPGCDEDWSAFQVRVSGNEPFWSVIVSDHGMQLLRPGHADQGWSEVTVTRSSEGLRYTAGDATGSVVELTITREDCRDTMSGSFFAFAAVLRVSGKELRGCALNGRSG